LTCCICVVPYSVGDIEAANLSNNVFRSTFFDEKEKKVSEGVENQFDAKFTLFFELIEKNNL